MKTNIIQGKHGRSRKFDFLNDWEPYLMPGIGFECSFAKLRGSVPLNKRIKFLAVYCIYLDDLYLYIIHVNG